MILSHLSPVLALLFYFIGAALSGGTEASTIKQVRYLVALALFFHLYSLFIFAPIASSHFLAFSMSIASLMLGMFFVISSGGKFKSLGQLTLGATIIIYLASSYLLHLGNPRNLQVKSAYLLWSHVGLSLVGILSFLASGILGLAYLSQAKALRRGSNERSLSTVIGRLPPLRDLSRLIKVTGKVGLFSAIIGLYLGFLYTESAGIQLNISEAKLLLPTMLVIYYGLILVFRSKISETMFAKLSSFGVILSISSLIIASAP